MAGFQIEGGSRPGGTFPFILRPGEHPRSSHSAVHVHLSPPFLIFFPEPSSPCLAGGTHASPPMTSLSRFHRLWGAFRGLQPFSCSSLSLGWRLCPAAAGGPPALPTWMTVPPWLSLPEWFFLVCNFRMQFLGVRPLDLHADTSQEGTTRLLPCSGACQRGLRVSLLMSSKLPVLMNSFLGGFFNSTVPKDERFPWLCPLRVGLKSGLSQSLS